MRSVTGKILKSFRLLRPGRYAYRKLVGLWKTVLWRLHTHNTAPDGLLFPPPHLCFPVTDSYDPLHFFSSGKIGIDAILNILHKNGINTGDLKRVLDFGCGCGRITRHWQNISGVDIFGIDKDLQLIRWARNNLTFGKFTTHQLKSKLNYPDNYFDFVYSIAVFGHFREEHQKHWMKEIRRVLKTGGSLLVTVKGSNRIGELSKEEAAQFNSGELVVIEPNYSGDHYCLAYDPYSYFSRHLAGGMEICYFEPSGSPDTRQDVYLLQKI